MIKVLLAAVATALVGTVAHADRHIHVALVGHAAPADPPDQFDLDCNGFTRPGADLEKTGPAEPWHRVISLDLSKGLAFIHGGSSVTSVIATPDRLVVSPSAFPITIYRSTGDFTQSVDVSSVGVDNETEGECVVHPYSGMPARAF